MNILSNSIRWLRRFLLIAIFGVVAVFSITAFSVSQSSELPTRLQVIILIGTIPTIVLCCILSSAIRPPSGPSVASEKIAENEVFLIRPPTTDSLILEFMFFCGIFAFLSAIACFGPIPMRAKIFAGGCSFLAALPLITFGATMKGGAGISKITILGDSAALRIIDRFGGVETREVLFRNMSLRYSKVKVFVPAGRYLSSWRDDEYLRIYDGKTALPKIRQKPSEIMSLLSAYGVPADQSPDRFVQVFIYIIVIGIFAGFFMVLKIFFPYESFLQPGRARL